MDQLAKSDARSAREITKGVSWETSATLLLTETLTWALGMAKYDGVVQD